MQAVDLTVIFALIASLSWGFADFFAAKASKSIGPLLSIVAISWIELPVFLIFYFLHNHSLHFATSGVIYAVLAGIAFLVASTLFFMALERGPVTLVSPISSTYPLITTLLVVLFFKAHLNFVECIGIVLIIIGVLSASGAMDGGKIKTKITPGIKLAIVTSLIWGVGFALLAQAVKHLGWLNASFVELITDSVFACFLLPFLGKGTDLSIKTIRGVVLDKFIWLNTILALGGLIFLEVAISKTTSNGGAVATAISSTYPILTMSLALSHFKEKVKPLALSGAALGIVGVLVLSL